MKGEIQRDLDLEITTTQVDQIKGETKESFTKKSNAIGEGTDLDFLKKKSYLWHQVIDEIQGQHKRGYTHELTFFPAMRKKGVYGRDWIRIACGMTSVENLNLKYSSYVNLNIAYTFRRVNVKVLNVLARWVRSYSPPSNVIAKEP